jgi:hypothetical protein
MLAVEVAELLELDADDALLAAELLEELDTPVLLALLVLLTLFVLLALLEVAGELSLPPPPPPPPHAERTSMSPPNRKPVFLIIFVSKLSPDLSGLAGATSSLSLRRP